MDTDLKTLLSFGGIAMAVVFFYGFLATLSLKKRAKVKAARKAQLLNLYSRDGVYLCYQVQNVGNRLVQFDGEPHGTLVKPGMTVTDPMGSRHVVKEVYNSDETNDPDLDIPEAELQNGETGTAIVVEAPSFNFAKFRQQLRQDGGYVALLVR